MGKIVIKELKKIPLDLIDIGEGNVRKTRQKAGLEELKTSIKKLGLIHPIIVVKENKRFKLVVGQRRYLAFLELGEKEIPAIIINPLSSTTEMLISFGENIHRKALPYSDTIQVCDQLFKSFSGTKFEKIERIAKSIGISPQTVGRYLAYRIIPRKLQEMVDEGKIGREKAYKITSAFWPNEEKIIKIAKYVSEMTPPEWERALDIGRKNPKASVEEIIEEARSPLPFYEITISVERNIWELLQKIAKERNKEPEDLIKDAIDELVKEEVEK